MAKRLFAHAVVTFAVCGWLVVRSAADEPTLTAAAEATTADAGGKSCVCKITCKCPCRGAAADDYAAEWERAGLGPYCIEAPDILLIEVERDDADIKSTENAANTDSSTSSPLEEIGGKCLVGPDGAINLGRFGKLDVNGRTLGDVRQAIEEQLGDAAAGAKINVKLAACNSRCVYLILDDAGSDTAQRINFRPNAKVGSVLRDASWPHPIDFSKAEITVRRVLPVVGDDLSVQFEESESRVKWDANENSPTEESDRLLLSNDRIVVKLPNVNVAAVQPIPAAFIARSNSASPADSTEPSTIKFDIRIVEDTSGSFQEFEQLRKMPFMLTDAATMRGTLRILERNDLIKQISSPKLIATAGEEATLEIGGPSKTEVWEGMKLNCSAREMGGGLIVSFGIKNTADKRNCELRTELVVPAGDTVVLKTSSPREKKAAQNEAQDAGEHPVYVVLTAEVVKQDVVQASAVREASRAPDAVAE